LDVAAASSAARQTNMTLNNVYKVRAVYADAGAPFGAHVVSADLAHWTWLPPVLLLDK
jgi:hypothetical protein